MGAMRVFRGIVVGASQRNVRVLSVFYQAKTRLLHFDRALIAISDGACTRPRWADRHRCFSKQIDAIGVAALKCL